MSDYTRVHDFLFWLSMLVGGGLSVFAIATWAVEEIERRVWPLEIGMEKLLDFGPPEDVQ